MFSAIATALLVASMSFAQTSRSDFDGDGSVGFPDFLLFAEAFAAENTPPVSSASYLVTFTSTWSESTHPIDFPQFGLASYSPLVGGTHTEDVVFWAGGEPASPGIKDMAETGQTGTLGGEVSAAINAGTAGAVLVANTKLDPTPGMTTMTFDIDENHPLVTLVTMIAPSSDWFVGVAGVNLFEGGEWVDEVSFELPPWDAGRDSGSTYGSEDSRTTPPDVIRAIAGSPLGSASVGTFTFTRQ